MVQSHLSVVCGLWVMGDISGSRQSWVAVAVPQQHFSVKSRSCTERGESPAMPLESPWVSAAKVLSKGTGGRHAEGTILPLALERRREIPLNSNEKAADLDGA